MKLYTLPIFLLIVFGCGSKNDSSFSNKHDDSDYEKLSKIPALELEQLPILDLGSKKPFLRAMTPQEIEKTGIYLRNQRDKAALNERDLINGDCANNSGYWAGIYGPHVSTRPYDNDLYMVPPGYKTPDGWDCDGFFIPRDVTVRMITSAVTFTKQGPGAVKINSAQWGTLESISSLERKIEATVLEWIGPENATNWYRPSFPQQDLDDLGDTWQPKPPVGR